MKTTISFVLTAACAAAQLSAQTTWIVDKANGPGAQFTEVQPAIQAAAPGDTILVRGGLFALYMGFTIDKAVHVVGSSDSGLNQPWTRGLVSIVGIQAGMSCELSNCFVSAQPGSSPPRGLSVQANSGRVHLNGVVVGGYEAGVIEFLDNADVVAHACAWNGMGQPVLVRNSHMRISWSTMTPSTPIPFLPAYLPAEALRVENATVLLQSVTIRGANEYSSITISWPATVGLSGLNSTLVCSAPCVIIGGYLYSLYPPYIPWYGILNFSGTLIRDPEALVDPPTLPAIVQTRYETFVNHVERNASFRTWVKGPPHGLALTAVSFAPLSPIPTPLGELWLDLSGMLVLDGLALDQDGWAHFDRTVNALAPIDRTYVLQSGLLNPATNSCLLSYPTFFGVQAEPQ